MISKKSKKHTQQSWFDNANTVLRNMLLQDQYSCLYCHLLSQILVTPVLNQIFINKNERMYCKCGPSLATNAENTFPCSDFSKRKMLFGLIFPNKQFGFSKKVSLLLKYFNISSFSIEIINLLRQETRKRKHWSKKF